jgi:hypothetical protein
LEATEGRCIFIEDSGRRRDLLYATHENSTEEVLIGILVIRNQRDKSHLLQTSKGGVEETVY